MKLYMSKADILKNYRQAKDKRAQIKILADLNVTDCNEIRDILREAGEKVGPNKKKKDPTPQKKKTKREKRIVDWKEAEPYDGPYYEAPCCLECWTRPICSKNGYRCNRRERLRRTV